MSSTDVFNKRLKDIRLKLGYSQEKMAVFLGVSRASIGFYENGERTPDISVLDKIISATKVPANYYLGYTDSMEENFQSINSLTGLNDTAISNLIDANTHALNAFIGHPLFGEFMVILEFFASPIMKPHSTKKLREYALFLANSHLQRIIMDIQDETKITKDYSHEDRAFKDYPPEDRDFMEIMIALDNKELDQLFKLTEEIRSYVETKRKSIEHRLFHNAEAIEVLKNGILADSVRIKQLEERKKVYEQAIERYKEIQDKQS